MEETIQAIHRDEHWKFVAIVQELVGNQVEDLRYRIETAVKEYSLHVRGVGQAATIDGPVTDGAASSAPEEPPKPAAPKMGRGGRPPRRIRRAL